MHLLDRIETQLISNRLPLVAITVAAVPYAMRWPTEAAGRARTSSHVAGSRRGSGSGLQAVMARASKVAANRGTRRMRGAR